jgi:hypothetical protein
MGPRGSSECLGMVWVAVLPAASMRRGLWPVGRIWPIASLHNPYQDPINGGSDPERTA